MPPHIKIYFLKSDPRTPVTGLNKLPATPVTSKAAVRMSFPSPSGSETVLATLKAKLVTGETNGMTTARTAVSSGVIMARASIHC